MHWQIIGTRFWMKSKNGPCKNLASLNLEYGTAFFAKKVKKVRKTNYGRHPIDSHHFVFLSPFAKSSTNADNSYVHTYVDNSTNAKRYFYSYVDFYMNLVLMD
jgi:hypothetical protein